MVTQACPSSLSNESCRASVAHGSQLHCQPGQWQPGCHSTLAETELHRSLSGALMLALTGCSTGVLDLLSGQLSAPRPRARLAAPRGRCGAGGASAYMPAER